MAITSSPSGAVKSRLINNKSVIKDSIDPLKKRILALEIELDTAVKLFNNQMAELTIEINQFKSSRETHDKNQTIKILAMVSFALVIASLLTAFVF